MNWTITGNVISGNTSGGIRINNGASAVISNNYIGVSGSGVNGDGLENGAAGVQLGFEGESGNYGVDDVIMEGNVIGNNSGTAIALYGRNMNSAVIQGNRIGVAYDGSAWTDPVPNSGGIFVDSSSITSLLIGGGLIGEGNVIVASSSGPGIDIHGVNESANVDIKGNYIGVAEDGMTTTGMVNSGAGILVESGADSIVIGGDNNLDADGNGTIGEGNVISNNYAGGIQLWGFLEGAPVEIYGNIIGLVKGVESEIFDTAAGNSLSYNGVGVQSEGGSVIVGATMADGAVSESSRRNIISGNLRGIILGNYSSTVKNNYIGTDVTGMIDVGNQYYGMGIGMGGSASGQTITIGGTSSADRNVISGNGGGGIMTGDYYGDPILNILGNYIGINSAGSAAIPNEGSGVEIHPSRMSGIIGGTINIGNGLAGGGNVISGNNSMGVGLIGDESTTYTANVLGNYIGTDATGMSAIPNGSNPSFNHGMPTGVLVMDQGGNLNITIGGIGDFEKNVISGNYYAGVDIRGGRSVRVIGNYIGLDAAGVNALGNQKIDDEVVDSMGLYNEMNGNGIGVVDWGFGGYVQTEVNGTIIQYNHISANEGNGISIVHQGPGGVWGEYEIIGGLGQDWTNGYIKDNVIGFAADDTTSFPNDGYGIYALDTVDPDPMVVGHFIELMIGGSNNIIETSLNYGIYLVEVGESALHGVSYSWLDEHNTFSNPLLTWQAIYRGVLQNGGDEEVDEEHVCGNGEQEEEEECDDGNTDNGDGCSSECEVEQSSGGGTLLLNIIPPQPKIEPKVETKTCPVGYTLQGKSCVRNQITCSTGFVQQGDKCVPITCQMGYVLSGNTCVKTACEGNSCNKEQTEQLNDQNIKQASKTITNHVTTTGSNVLINDLPEVSTEGVDNDKCKTDSDCGQNYSCEKSGDGRICLEKKPVDCTSTSGNGDANFDGIPDCLEPATIEVGEENTKQLADKVVFGLTGAIPAVPSISNLEGKTVDQKPLVLVTYKPNREVSLIIERAESTKKLVVSEGMESDPMTGKKENVKITTLVEIPISEQDREVKIGSTVVDNEYKGQISVDSPLPEGRYYATLGGDDGVKSRKVMFEVAKTNMEIQDIQVVIDNNAESEEIQPLAKNILRNVELADNSGRFVADEYVDYRDSQSRPVKYRIKAKIASQNTDRKIAYFTYRSTIFASVALTDANENGEYIDVEVPGYVARNESHKLSAYLSDAKNTMMSNARSINFSMQ